MEYGCLLCHNWIEENSIYYATRSKASTVAHTHTWWHYFHVRMWEFVGKCQWFFLISIYTLTCHLLRFQLSFSLRHIIHSIVCINKCACVCLSLAVWESANDGIYSCGIFKLYSVNYLLFHRLYVIKIQQKAIILYTLIRIHIIYVRWHACTVCTNIFQKSSVFTKHIKCGSNIFATKFWPIIF